MDFDFEIDTTGLENLLKKLPEETGKKVTRNAVSAGARVIRDGAKQLAPYDSSRKSGTHLRDGIVVKRVPRTNDLYSIGTLKTGKKAVPHAHLVEFGTIAQPPKPFLRPAVLINQQVAVLKIFKIMANGIFREAKKLAGRK